MAEHAEKELQDENVIAVRGEMLYGDPERRGDVEDVGAAQFVAVDVDLG